MVLNDFRIHHRAASESLLQAAADDADLSVVAHELEKARYFETEALKYITTHRQRALAIGLLHAVDLMESVANTEFDKDNA